MKKRYLIIYISIVVIMIGIIYITSSLKKTIVLKDEHNSKKVNINTLSIMFETETDSGIYEERRESGWPTEGYTFNAERSKCENGSELSWENNKVVMKGNISDKCYVYFDKEPDIIYLSDYIKGLYKADGTGEPGLYYHNGTITTTSLGIDENNKVLDANDNSYRYAGANPNNYVCFGYDDPAKAYAANWCPDDNLYRIIGVFNDNVVGTDGNLTGAKEERVKLIKAKTYGSYYWSGADSNKSNVWANSTLNTETLNGTTENSYLTKLGTWSNKIATTRWHVGGAKLAQLRDVIAPVSYQNEVGSPVNNIIQDSKVGLMYVSEYMYAADPKQKNAWSELVGRNSDATKDYSAVKDFNWMSIGSTEWTISRNLDLTYSAFHVINTGRVYDYYVYNYRYVVRPSFSLLNSIAYSGGSGTAENPIRIS